MVPPVWFQLLSEAGEKSEPAGRVTYFLPRPFLWGLGFACLRAVGLAPGDAVAVAPAASADFLSGAAGLAAATAVLLAGLRWAATRLKMAPPSGGTRTTMAVSYTHLGKVSLAGGPALAGAVAPGGAVGRGQVKAVPDLSLIHI